MNDYFNYQSISHTKLSYDFSTCNVAHMNYFLLSNFLIIQLNIKINNIGLYIVFDVVFLLFWS